MGDADDRGQGGGVWIVNHNRAGLRIDPLPETRGIAGERQRSCRARLDHAAAVHQLGSYGARHPPCADRSPLDELPAANGDEAEHHEDKADRERHDHRAPVEAEDQSGGGEARHHELRA